jgi:hypothetical protein
MYAKWPAVAPSGLIELNARFRGLTPPAKSYRPFGT